MIQTTRKHMRIFRRHPLSMTLLSYYGCKRMIVLNNLSFGRYLLLKRFWSRTLLVLQLQLQLLKYSLFLETDCIIRKHLTVQLESI